MKPLEHSINDRRNTVNPEQTSFVEKNLIIEYDPIKQVYVEKNSGEIFHEITKSPLFQRFISLICKGVINTADVVYSEGKFFSHQQDMKNLVPKETQESFIGELEAERFIFKSIFGDPDKYGTDNLALEKAKEKDSRKRYWFDHEKGDTRFGNGIQSENEEIKRFFKDNLIYDLTELRQDHPDQYANIVRVLNYKSGQFLQGLLNEKNFDSFQSIVKKAFFDPKKLHPSHLHYNFQSENLLDQGKELFDDLRRRFEVLYQLTQDIS